MIHAVSRIWTNQNTQAIAIIVIDKPVNLNTWEPEFLWPAQSLRRMFSWKLVDSAFQSILSKKLVATLSTPQSHFFFY